MIEKTVSSYKDWAERYLREAAAPTSEPLTMELMLTMAHLMVEENTGVDLSYVFVEELSDQFLWKLINTRADILSLEITKGAAFFLMAAFPSPGKLVMVISALSYYQRKIKAGKITINTIAEIFPFGLPREAVLSRLWDAQKVERKGIGSDNLLDYVEIITADVA